MKKLNPSMAWMTLWGILLTPAGVFSGGLARLARRRPGHLA